MSSIAENRASAQQSSGRPPKPKAPAPIAENIPIEVRDLARWVLWRYEWVEGKNGKPGKWTKVPYNARTGKHASSTDAATWSGFPEAMDALGRRRGFDGIGFVLVQDDDLVGVDVDNCLAENGTVEAWARPVVDGLSPCYWEKTPSGRGLRAWVRGKLPPGPRKKVIAPGKAVEVYEHARYLTATGDLMDGSSAIVVGRAAELLDLHARIFAPKWTEAKAKADPKPAPDLTTDDAALLDKARSCRKTGAEFSALYDHGDLSGHQGDASNADFGLLRHLAFWTNKDAGRMEAMFNGSALAKRDKWGREDYRARSIEAAIAGTNNGYIPPPPKAKAKPDGNSPPTIPFPSAKPEPDPSFANFSQSTIQGKEGEDDKVIRRPYRISQLADHLRSIAGPWPKRVEDRLFWEDGEHEPVYLDSSHRLFAWIDHRAKVDWTKGSRFITQVRFYEHLRMTSEKFGAIETLPHWPRLPGIYYMHREVPEPTGKLEGFLSFFSPSTPADRELIKSLLLTLVWGGPPGRRPAFLITGPENDPHQGRGLGKSTLPDIIADELMGGSVDVSPTDAIADVKTRLLSGGGYRKRIARLDNIKTLKFSWADLEGLITASEISGRALYIGEGCRPNTLVWITTLNGASLSKDMAQRVIPIRLARPQFTPKWEATVRDYAREHRWSILADLGAILQTDPGTLVPKTRWARWERDVLSKTDLPEECQALMIERQGSVDEDSDDRDLVIERFREEIRRRHYDPETCHLFIRSATVAEWLSQATRQPWPTNRASSHVAGLGIAELRKGKRVGVLGWYWKGAEANPGATADAIDPPHGAGAGAGAGADEDWTKNP